MSKGAYIGVDGVARKVKKMFIGIGSAKNILSNGSLKTSTTDWTMSSNYSVTQNDGFCTINVTGETGTGTYPCYQLFNKISGNTDDTKQIIYCCAKVRGKSTNISYPRVYVRYYKDGSTTATYYNLSEISGLKETELNDGNWHTMSIRLVTYDDSGYYDFDRIAFGISTSTTGDTMDIKEVFVCNLTEDFGRGNEPTKEWCDNNLTNYAEEIKTQNALSKARQIKKAYIGIGGVARPCFSKELEYYGAITTLTTARDRLAATTVGNYALFGGGAIRYDFTNTVEVYDKNLTKTTAPNLHGKVFDLAATTVGNYALFGGGNSSSTGAYSTSVTAYNKSLSKTSATTLNVAMCNHCATTLGNNALFIGNRSGYNSTNAYVNVYDTSLTHTLAGQLSVPRVYAKAVSIGGYAIIAGGGNTTVEVLDSSLTSRTITALSYQRYSSAATTVGNYAIFAGGAKSNTTGTTAYKAVDCYDKSLTKISITQLPINNRDLAATTVGNYALFGGGATCNEGDADRLHKTVVVYDTSLTQTTTSDLSKARGWLAATTIGNYAIFAGGSNNESSYYNTVDVYTA